MACLDAIAFVKEVSVGSEGIEVEDFVGTQTTFAGDDNHGGVPRGWKFLLVGTDVLQAHEVVKLEQLITRQDEALLVLIERMHRVVVFEHRLLKPTILFETMDWTWAPGMYGYSRMYSKRRRSDPR
jgi:hypothetical protein